MNLDQINEQNKYNKFSTRFYSDCQTKRVDFFQPTFKELGDKNENLHQQPEISFFSNHFKYILNCLYIQQQEYLGLVELILKKGTQRFKVWKVDLENELDSNT